MRFPSIWRKGNSRNTRDIWRTSIPIWLGSCRRCNHSLISKWWRIRSGMTLSSDGRKTQSEDGRVIGSCSRGLKSMIKCTAKSVRSSLSMSTLMPTTSQVANIRRWKRSCWRILIITMGNSRMETRMIVNKTITRDWLYWKTRSEDWRSYYRIRSQTAWTKWGRSRLWI